MSRCYLSCRVIDYNSPPQIVLFGTIFNVFSGVRINFENIVTLRTFPFMSPPTSTSSLISKGLFAIIRSPLARLLNVPWSANPTTNPAAPIAANKGERSISRAERPARKPKNSIALPDQSTMKLRKRLEVAG